MTARRQHGEVRYFDPFKKLGNLLPAGGGERLPFRSDVVGIRKGTPVSYYTRVDSTRRQVAVQVRAERQPLPVVKGGG
jgi:hypothetical protein